MLISGLSPSLLYGRKRRANLLHTGYGASIQSKIKFGSNRNSIEREEIIAKIKTLCGNSRRDRALWIPARGNEAKVEILKHHLFITDVRQIMKETYRRQSSAWPESFPKELKPSPWHEAIEKLFLDDPHFITADRDVILKPFHSFGFYQVDPDLTNLKIIIRRMRQEKTPPPPQPAERRLGVFERSKPPEKKQAVMLQPLESPEIADALREWAEWAWNMRPHDPLMMNAIMSNELDHQESYANALYNPLVTEIDVPWGLDEAGNIPSSRIHPDISQKIRRGQALTSADMQKLRGFLKVHFHQFHFDPQDVPSTDELREFYEESVMRQKGKSLNNGFLNDSEFKEFLQELLSFCLEKAGIR